MKIPLVWLKDYLETTKSIKELAADFTQLGLMLDKPLDDTNVMDLEQRLNRSDLLSMIGCTRDLAAFEGLSFNLPKGYTKPGHKPSTTDQIPVKVEIPVVRRFQTRVFRGIKVGPSPKWLVERLEAYGMESKNNIVDITNFVMVEYGQPMHAQDLAKLRSPEITIRPAKLGEKITTLLGTEIKLDPDIFVLSSGGEVTVIGGIVGGKNTGVTTSTTDIILDAGNYDSRVIRKNSRRIKVINESVSRYDKFLDPRLIDVALARATSLILELAGGTYFDNDDYYPSPVTPKTIILRLSRLALLSGMQIPLPTVKKILKSLGYVVIEEGEGTLNLEIPYFRTDIEVEDDLVSDILRIHDYTNIPTEALTTPIPKDITLSITRFEEKLQNLMISQGGHEHITNSLTTFNDQSGQVKLANALTTDQNTLRTNLVDGLNKVLLTYKKHKINTSFVFEIGKVFAKSSTHYLEGRFLTALFSDTNKVASSLATLLGSLGVNNYTITKDLEIKVREHVVGKIMPSSYTLVTDQLIQVALDYSGIVSEFTHTTSLDLSLLAAPKLSYADIIGVINSLKGSWVSTSCSAMTKLKDGNNYLLTCTWESDKNMQKDKINILKALKEKLGITSKS